jgi:hypothetical protein|tara:strand:- start:4253 stop:4438 length:186 start_codon:yes stop_codon:yes gene_type:complete
MRRGKQPLATRAKQQISICCKTLCEREVVEEYIKELEDEVEWYREWWKLSTQKTINGENNE